MRRFFCENCGTEVTETSEVCPECGAFFVAIKCPRCGFRGKPHQFRHGCPKCGYLGDTHLGSTHEEAHTRGEKGTLRGFGHLFRFDWSRRSVPVQKRELPPWVFWLALAGLVVGFVVISIVYVRL